MTAYLVVDIEVHDPEKYQDYVDQAHLFVAKHGGRYRVRGGNAEAIEGAWLPRRFVVAEFPSREQAKAFINDPEYRKVAAIRHATADSNMILVDGVE